MSIKICKSSALSISVLLIFEIQEINDAIILKAIFLSYVLSGLATLIFPFATIYASLKAHKSHLSIDVLNLICLLGLYLSSALPDLS